MKLGAFSVLDAMGWPWTTLGFEGYVIWWVPVSCGEYLCVCFFEDFYVVVKNWNHLVAFGNGQCAKSLLNNLAEFSQWNSIEIWIGVRDKCFRIAAHGKVIKSLVG